MSGKKWWYLLCLVVCMLSLTSCGKDDQEDVSYVDYRSAYFKYSRQLC